MMPVGGQPFLERLIERLAAQHVTECVLCLGHGAADISAYFDTHPIRDVRLHYSIESEALGTAGALRVAESFWAKENLVLNGDTELEFDLLGFLAFHRTQHAEVTIGLAQVQDASLFGRVRTAADGQVLEFLEKDGRPDPGFVNAGIYLATRRALGLIPAAGQVSIEKEWMPALLRERRWVYGHKIADEFIDIGTPDNYRRLVARVPDSSASL
jgi:NDP-sugar pyrophosphorylase family protein